MPSRNASMRHSNGKSARRPRTAVSVPATRRRSPTCRATFACGGSGFTQRTCHSLGVTHAEPQLDNVSVTATRCDGGRNRAAAIDHEEITRVKKAAQFGEAGVPDRLDRPVDDHQTHAITAQPTELG